MGLQDQEFHALLSQPGTPAYYIIFFLNLRAPCLKIHIYAAT